MPCTFRRTLFMDELFIELLQVALAIRTELSYIPCLEEWSHLYKESQKQGLVGFISEGFESLPLSQKPPKDVLLYWIGQTLQEEKRFDFQRQSSIKLASLFSKNDIRTYILKGIVIAECYPISAHRFSADVDCFLLDLSKLNDAWEKGNYLVETAGYKVRFDYYKHSTFLLPCLTVENHKFLTPFRGNKRLEKLEFLLQKLLREDMVLSKFPNSELYRPPVMVSTLFLIEHSYSHFLQEGLNWRHVLDWVMYSKKHREEIDWNLLNKWINECGFRRFYDSYYNLGQYLMGEIRIDNLSERDILMLQDIWAPLDLHETTNGIKGKMNIIGNIWRARWKYKVFADTNWLQALWALVKGFLFIKDPKLKSMANLTVDLDDIR